MTLLELAERCEKAEGPDPNLGCDILMACGKQRLPQQPPRQNDPTASLDAAMTLVPDTMRLSTLHCHHMKASWRASLWVLDENEDVSKLDLSGYAKTGPLALCAAALRACAAQQEVA